MRTIIILEDVTLTATEKTIREYEAELAEAQELLAEMDWERQARKALHEAYKNGDWGLYSDLHKDLYGVRPRW